MKHDIEKIANDLQESSFNIHKLDKENFSSLGGDINILYLEDKESDACLVKEVLDIDDVNIDIAHNYELAIAKFELKYYNAFIVDILLNDKYSGFDYIDFLQKMGIKNIVVLTGFTNEEVKRKCTERGIDKIYKKEEIFNLINSGGGNAKILENLLFN